MPEWPPIPRSKCTAASSHADRYKRPPRKKCAALSIPVIVTEPSKRNRILRREEAPAVDKTEVSPEIEVFFAGMTRPPGAA